MKKYENVLKNSGEFLTPDQVKKMDALCQVMIAVQPEIEDFRGQPRFSNNLIETSKQKLSAKIEEIKNRNKNRQNSSNDDIYARMAEPIIAYIFSGKERSAFEDKESFAFLASDYDDLLNGTDIVLSVQNKEGKNDITCSIDVTTATNAQKIAEKFQRSSLRRGSTPPYCSYVKFCEFDGRYWTAEAAPHFTLGLMPSRVENALDNIEFNDGIIAGRKKDEATDFKLFSEMYEQILMQETKVQKEYGKSVTTEPFYENLEVLRGAVRTKLEKICKVEGADEETRQKNFEIKYGSMKRKHREDLVYKNIVDACTFVNLGTTALGNR